MDQLESTGRNEITLQASGAPKGKLERGQPSAEMADGSQSGDTWREMTSRHIEAPKERGVR